MFQSRLTDKQRDFWINRGKKIAQALENQSVPTLVQVIAQQQLFTQAIEKETRHIDLHRCGDTEIDAGRGVSRQNHISIDGALLNPEHDPVMTRRMEQGLFVPERINTRPPVPQTEPCQGVTFLEEVENLVRGSYRTAKNIREITRSGKAAETDHEQITDEHLKKYEVRALRQYAKSTNRYWCKNQFDELLAQALADGITQGLEHEVYFHNGRWFKRHPLNYMTFGFTDYFQRLLLTNRMNSGCAAYRLEGFIDTADMSEYMPVASQPHISGTKPSITEVNDTLAQMGFTMSESPDSYGMTSWYYPGENYIVSDVYHNNAIKMANGEIVFFDPVIVPDAASKHQRIDLVLQQIEGGKS